MCTELLTAVYRMFLQRTNIHSAFIEPHVTNSHEPETFSEDTERNRPSTYAALFSGDCSSHLENLYLEAIQQMNGLSFDGSEDILNGLAFIQEVVATALWRYDCNVGPTLESFAREFDRLDVPAERHRLHSRCQGS